MAGSRQSIDEQFRRKVPPETSQVQELRPQKLNRSEVLAIESPGQMRIQVAMGLVSAAAPLKERAAGICVIGFPRTLSKLIVRPGLSTH